VKTSAVVAIAVLAAALLVVSGVAGGLYMGRQGSVNVASRGSPGFGGGPADWPGAGESQPQSGLPGDQSRGKGPGAGGFGGAGGAPGGAWGGQGFPGQGFAGPGGGGPNSSGMPFPGGAPGGRQAGASGPAGRGRAGAGGSMNRGPWPMGGGAGQPGRPRMGARQQGDRAAGGPPGGMSASGPMGPAFGPWAGPGPAPAGPPQGFPAGAAPGMWPGGRFGGPGGPDAESAAGAPPMPGTPVNLAYGVLDQLQRGLGLLASAAEDLENASVALREKNQDQVKEILHSGAQKLTKVSTDWRGLANELRGGPPPGGQGAFAGARRGQFGGPRAFEGAAGPGPRGRGSAAVRPGAPSPRGPAAPGTWDGSTAATGNEAATGPLTPNVFAPIAVPSEEPTAPRDREALEERVRLRLRLLYWPYVRLIQDGVEMPEVQELVRSCRDAVNGGALRDAALSLNAAAEMMGRLLAAAEGEQPGGPAPDSASAGPHPE